MERSKIGKYLTLIGSLVVGVPWVVAFALFFIHSVGTSFTESTPTTLGNFMAIGFVLPFSTVIGFVLIALGKLLRRETKEPEASDNTPPTT